MTTIGIDSSGTVKQIDRNLNMVAVKPPTKNREQKHWIIRVSPEQHIAYLQLLKQRQLPATALIAILMFKSCNRIYFSGDNLEIDPDVWEERRTEVEGFLKKLFGSVHAGRFPACDPQMCWLHDYECESVSVADFKAQKAKKYEQLPYDERDPSIAYELSLLR